MPFGIRPSNVRVCHSTTRAQRRVLVNGKLLVVARKRFVGRAFVLMSVLLIETRIEREWPWEHEDEPMP